MQSGQLAIQYLNLVNFKNYKEAAFDFHPKLNIIAGNNGVGKTNLLDAIYYTCVSKSYLSADNLVFRHEADFFRIECDLAHLQSAQKIEIKYPKTGKKELAVQGVKQDKITEYVGRFPVVMITPDDSELILGSSDNRRRFLDAMLSQLSKAYLSDILLYNKLLQQRNAVLKSFYENRKTDLTLLQAYDEKWVPLGKKIYLARKNGVVALLPVFHQIYQTIFKGKEAVHIQYKSDLEDTDFDLLIKQTLQQDIAAQRSTKGIHTDDCLFSLNTFPLKKTGSQGQQKTFLLSLKLAQYQLMKDKLACSPVLLLDDIFDKLDSSRIQQIIRLVSTENFGQVFFSDTEKHRMEKLFDENSVTSYKIIQLGEL